MKSVKKFSAQGTEWEKLSRMEREGKDGTRKGFVLDGRSSVA
ncbi:MAG: hypothetical protein N3B10_11110 [Armatimonadetes bacterium]|nr:hypothetical protein [Armatimonadota bacterium]MCX7969015.1 hypothetical protein [Armatimonadota bacterium]MDW8142562.1 hypothetical protein [Armatimonadota bacterium]